MKIRAMTNMNIRKVGMNGTIVLKRLEYKKIFTDYDTMVHYHVMKVADDNNNKIRNVMCLITPINDNTRTKTHSYLSTCLADTSTSRNTKLWSDLLARVTEKIIMLTRSTSSSSLFSFAFTYSASLYQEFSVILSHVTFISSATLLSKL